MKQTKHIQTAFAALTLIVSSPFAFAQAPAVSPKPTPVPRTAESAVTPSATPRNAGRHDQFLYRIKQGEVGLLFLGDSITDNWPRLGEWSWLKFAPNKPANFGVGGERTEDVLTRITNGELEGINPKVTVIMIGTNNIGQCPDEQPEWAAAGVKKIVETVHQKLPNTNVLLLAVFPRNSKDNPMWAKVEAINQIISKLDDGKKTRFLDINKVFLNEQGEIPRDVMPDLLHPNAHGYDLWYEAMSSVLNEMLRE